MSMAPLYLMLIDSCIPQLKAQGPSRTCSESKEEEEAAHRVVDLVGVPLSSEYGTCKTVKARFWPWLRPDSGLGFQVEFLKTY